MIIAVASCSKYSDAWHPFIKLFRKFWPNCKWPVYLLTDECNDSHEGYDVKISIKQDKGWTYNLKAMLEQVIPLPSDLVLLFQEDFFITEPVDQDFIATAVGIMSFNDFGFLRLYPCPGADRPWSKNYPIGLIDEHAPYKASCQAAIWKREYLTDILSCAKNTMLFELHGTKIAWQKSEPCLAVEREAPKWPLQYLCSAINRGIWSLDAVRLCQQHGINLDLSRRPVGK